MVPLTTGDPAPLFTAPTLENHTFRFATLAGRWIILAFGPDLATLAPFRAAFAGRPDLQDDNRLALFCVVRAGLSEAFGSRCFADPAGAIAASYGVTAARWVLLDPTLRVYAQGDLDDSAGALGLLADLPQPGDHAGAPLNAPVLIVPRVFEPEFCRTLIDHYRAQGGEESGFMREVDGFTRLMTDPRHKQRKDVILEAQALIYGTRERIRRRLTPEIHKAFQFETTRIERYLVACYAAGAGWFRPHRDNTTKGTAHRKFAVSINLNAEEYDGGDLRFPEFGPRTYRPPTGGAVVFSCSLLHEATNVTAGERYAFLPFLYDEAGAKVREQNAAFVKLDNDAPAAKVH
jgi:hypothetical protein